MALTVNITSSNNSPTVGTQIALTANPSGQASGATLAYAWTVNGTAVSGTGSGITYTPSSAGKTTFGVTVTATTTGDTPTTETQSATLDVTAVNKKFTGINATVSSSKTNGVVGDSITYLVAYTGAPEGSSATYAWYENDSSTPVAGQTDYQYVRQYGNAGTTKVHASVTLSAPGYDSATFFADDITVTITNNTMTPTMTLSPSATSVKEGVTYTVTANISGAPTGSTAKFAWTKNGTATSDTGNSVTDSSNNAGTVTWACTATVSANGYDDATTSANTSVTITAPDYDTGTVDYYHILPQRNSVFYQVGWWVMDLIQECVANGVDWTDPDTNKLKWAEELRTVAKLVNEFDNVEIQESRNGWILGKDRIKSGKIYTW